MKDRGKVRKYSRRQYEELKDYWVMDSVKSKLIDLRRTIGIPTEGLPLESGVERLQKIQSEYSAEISEFYEWFNNSFEIKIAKDAALLIPVMVVYDLAILLARFVRGEVILENALDEWSTYHAVPKSFEPIWDRYLSALSGKEIIEALQGSYNKRIYFEYQRDYPIRLNISPHASINEIKQFIDDNSSEIKALQGKVLKGQRPKRRRVNPSRRVRDFIYSHQTKTPDKVYDLLEQEFGKEIADKYGFKDNIQTILNREKKRRKLEQ